MKELGRGSEVRGLITNLQFVVTLGYMYSFWKPMKFKTVPRDLFCWDGLEGAGYEPCAQNCRLQHPGYEPCARNGTLQRQGYEACEILFLVGTGWNTQGTNPVLKMAGGNTQGTNPVPEMADHSA